MSGHLIVGAGPAGLAAIDTIRQWGDNSDITLVCDEPPYSRMVLPYLMDGTIPEANIYTASEAYLADKNVTAHLGRRVTSLDVDGEATLDDGTTIAFDDALIATGSSPIRPPIPGADSAEVFNLWNIEDAKAVIERSGGHVAVIGAGFIAFTCLDALMKLGASVTVIEVEERILPRMIDAEGATLVRRWLESKGVAFRTSTKVQAIEDQDGRKRLDLGNDSIDADVVILATGIRPNLGFLGSSRLEIDAAVVVDDHMRSSAPNVFAAGDVAQGPVVGSKERSVHAIQPTALEHGRIAGANMAGHDTAYWGSLLMNIVDVAKLQIASFGEWQGEGRESRILMNETGPTYRKLVFDGDKLVGAIFLGRPSDVAMLNDMGMVKGLIQTQVSLREWRAYLDKNPLDVRRPYVASRAAEKLLELRLVGKPSSAEGYRYPDPEPKYWPYHDVFVASAPDVNA